MAPMPHPDCPWTPDRWQELGEIVSGLKRVEESVRDMRGKMEGLSALSGGAGLSKKATGSIAAMVGAMTVGVIEGIRAFVK